MASLTQHSFLIYLISNLLISNFWPHSPPHSPKKYAALTPHSTKKMKNGVDQVALPTPRVILNSLFAVININSFRGTNYSALSGPYILLLGRLV